MTSARNAAAWILAASIGTAASAQWDPANGRWLKSDAHDVRVMTWNVEDGITSSANKSDSFNAWNGLARIVAAMEPDVLILQEVGNGNSVAVLQTTIDQFINGGSGVGSYVRRFSSPGYTLPHVFVSTATDGFNRNVIISRFPCADLNGAGSATFADIFVTPDAPSCGGVAYQCGGNGGIRGFQFAGVDLPDATYAGDLVIGNSHLKSGGTTSDQDARRRAAQNIAYFIDYYYNGAGCP